MTADPTSAVSVPGVRAHRFPPANGLTRTDPVAPVQDEEEPVTVDRCVVTGSGLSAGRTLGELRPGLTEVPSDEGSDDLGPASLTVKCAEPIPQRPGKGDLAARCRTALVRVQFGHGTKGTACRYTTRRPATCVYVHDRLGSMHLVYVHDSAILAAQEA